MNENSENRGNGKLQTEANSPNMKGFVQNVISRIAKDTGFRAAMKRAWNPATEPYAWPFLIEYGKVDLQNERVRRAFGLIGSILAEKRIQSNGTQSLGSALRNCKVSVTEADERMERRLRRILACDSTLELLPILRNTLLFILQKESVSIDFGKLLWEILCFGENIKIRWARDYYYGELSSKNSESSSKEEGFGKMESTENGKE